MSLRKLIKNYICSQPTNPNCYFTNPAVQYECMYDADTQRKILNKHIVFRMHNNIIDICVTGYTGNHWGHIHNDGLTIYKPGSNSLCDFDGGVNNKSYRYFKNEIRRTYKIMRKEALYGKFYKEFIQLKWEERKHSRSGVKTKRKVSKI